MACAELVDSQLRSGIRAARSSGHRCFKAVVVGGAGSKSSSAPALGEFERVDTGQRTLALATAVAESPGASLNDEFSRCMAALVEDTKPCLLLFRSDANENVDGSRWLLVAWLPEGAPEVERMTYVRSRGILARLVPQPYFLREFFAKTREDLVWDVARAGSEASEASLPVEVLEAASIFQRGARPPPLMARLAPQGPLREGQNLATVLQRLGRREDICIRLFLARPPAGGVLAEAVALADGKQAQPPLPVVECQLMDFKSPTELQAWLSRGGVPSSTCFFAMPMRDHLLFIFWCPDAATKDTHRVIEDTRHAVAKASVIRLLLEAFPAPKPYVAQVEAREPQDVLDGAGAAAATAKRQAAGVVDFQTPVSEQDHAERRQPLPARAVPATMVIDVTRPFPPWRGGSKATTIASSTGPSRTLGLAPPSSHQKRVPRTSAVQ